MISGDASPHVSDADPITRGKPIAKIMPVTGAPEPEKARKTADALNHYLKYAYDRLHKLKSAPANMLVTQRSGRRVSLQPFADQWGMRPLMIASSAVYAGLANELGFDFTRVADTGDPGRDLRERIRMALDDTKHDFIHVHTKVPDETSHKGTARMKKKAIASLDAGMDELAAALLKTKKKADILAVVTGDHSTPCNSALVHSGETVPVIFAGRTVTAGPGESIRRNQRRRWRTGPDAGKRTYADDPQLRRTQCFKWSVSGGRHPALCSRGLPAAAAVIRPGLCETIGEEGL